MDLRICHLFGPLEGWRHDAFMLRESGLLQELERKMNKANGDPYVIYGDPAYPVRSHILAPFRNAQLTPAEQNFNEAMSAVRTSVEWGYGKIVKYFAFVDFSMYLNKSLHTALAIEHFRGLDLVLHRVHGQIKLTFIISILHLAAQKKTG